MGRSPRLRVAMGVAILAFPASSALAQIVRDFSPGTSPIPYRLNGARALVNNHLLFEIDDPELGAELWTVDLDDGFPRLLADFAPELRTDGRQLSPSHVVWSGPDYALLEIETRETGSNATALWVTNGTVEGTRELRPTLQLFQVVGPIPGTNRVCFTAIDGGRFGLWVTDGRAEGTRSIGNISAASGIFPPVSALEWQGRLVFKGLTLARPEAFWQTDGTPEGTGPLVDLVPGAPDPPVGDAAVTTDGLHFLAFRPERLTELWGLASRTGTPVNLATVSNTGDRRGVFSSPWSVGRQLYFVAGDEYRGAPLWRWDPQAPVPLEAVSPSFGPNTEIWLEGSAHDGQVLAFWVFDFTTRDSSIWMSDGTPNGLRRVHSVVAPSTLFRVTEIRHALHGFVVSTWDLPPGSPEVRRFDASSPSTVLLPSIPSQFSLQSFRFRDQAGFFASEPGGFSIWSSDGSPTRLDRLFRGAVPEGGTVRCLVLDRDRLACYTLDSERQAELWLTEGSPATTSHRAVGEALDAIGASTPMTVLGNAPEGMYLQAEPSGAPGGLWLSNGTGAGTRLVLDRTAISGDVFAVAPTGGVTYFLVHGSSTCGVWALPAAGGEPRCVATTRFVGVETTIHQGQLYFFGDGSVFRTQGLSSPIELSSNLQPRALVSTSRGVFVLGESSLGSTDGTVAGSRVIFDLPGQTRSIAAIGDQLYLTVDRAGGEEPSALWTSDGSGSGTRMLAPLPVDRTPGPLRAAGGRLFLLVASPDLWEELWTLDPRASQPSWRLVRRLVRNPFSGATDSDLEVLGSRILFAANDSTLGAELWVSDGTEEGTLPLIDLWPGRLGSRPQDLTWLGGGLMAFSAADPAHGRELWLTDGTVDGTRRLADLAPGRRSSIPQHFVLREGKVFFSASDGAHGRELFTVPLSGLPDAENEPPFGPWLSSPSVPGFRFKVRIGDAPGVAGVRETACLAETLCVSGAVRGRSEVFLRVVGPRPNGRLWPTLVKFTTAAVEVWVEQLATGVLRHYRLDGASPDVDELPGFFDREGFVP